MNMYNNNNVMHESKKDIEGRFDNKVSISENHLPIIETHNKPNILTLLAKCEQLSITLQNLFLPDAFRK